MKDFLKTTGIFNIRLLWVAVIAGILLAGAAPTLADLGAVRFFIDNRPAPVKSLVKDGEIYVSLKDLAPLMPGRVHLDTEKNRVYLYRQKPVDISSLPEKKTPEPGIYGRILWPCGGNVQFPLENVEVFLYIQKEGLSDSEAEDAFRRWASGADGDYARIHGLVRKSVTDADGGFHLGRVPPGDYEITALVPAKGGSSGVFWRKRISVKDGEPKRVILDRENGISY